MSTGMRTPSNRSTKIRRSATNSMSCDLLHPSKRSSACCRRLKAVSSRKAALPRDVRLTSFTELLDAVSLDVYENQVTVHADEIAREHDLDNTADDVPQTVSVSQHTIHETSKSA